MAIEDNNKLSVVGKHRPELSATKKNPFNDKTKRGGTGKAGPETSARALIERFESTEFETLEEIERPFGRREGGFNTVNFAGWLKSFFDALDRYHQHIKREAEYEKLRWRVNQKLLSPSRLEQYRQIITSADEAIARDRTDTPDMLGAG